MKLITLENIDDITNDLMAHVRGIFKVKTESDVDNEIYSAIHNQLKESLDPWREEKQAPLDIQIQRIYRFESDEPLKAFADIIINDALLIKGIKVLQGKKGLMVSMPQEQAKDQKWYDSVRCLTQECKEQITDAVLSVYNEK